MTAPKLTEATLFDLRRLMQERTGLSIKQADQFIQAFLGLIMEELEKGRPVLIREFGRFGFRLWKGRTMHGVVCPTKLQIKFKASLKFRRRMTKVPIDAAIYCQPAPRRNRPPKKASILI